jgi:hypothetical protein
MAQAELVLGKDNDAVVAIENAVTVDPRTPSTAWDAANLLIALGRTREAMTEFKLVMEMDPARAPQAIGILLRAGGTPEEIEKLALPLNPEVHLALIQALMNRHDRSAAIGVWRSLIQLHQWFRAESSFDFLDGLLRNGDFSAFAACWHDLESSNGQVARLRSPGNLIENAGFEYSFLNGGLDWRANLGPDGTVQFDSSEHHEGNRSLLVTFLPSRSTDTGIRQYIVLDPDSKYLFTGYMKGDLASAEGLRFVLTDAYTHEKYFETNDVVSTRDWIKLSSEFTTRPGIHLAVLSMGRSTQSLIKGNIWIDDLRLEKVPQSH